MSHGLHHTYRFLTHWRVRATQDEVHQLLADVPALAQWWPSVYLDVRTLPHRTASPLSYALFTTGWLPYTLRWILTPHPSSTQDTLCITAHGDLTGRGVWTLTPRGEDLQVTFLWEVRADKPLLRHLSWLLKPVFSANHHWAMRRGLQSLRLELARRRHPDFADVPEPPQPTFRMFTRR